MRNLNPVIPVPALIAIASAAVLIMLFAWITSRENRIKSTLALLRRLAILALSGIIALRPMTEEHGTDMQLSNLDILFVLDTTLSMWADDGYEDTRIDSAKNDIEGIMEELPGANFALITFRNESTVVSPFTQDADTILRYLKSITVPDRYYVAGSRMDVPYYDIESMLISSDRKENRQTILFFMSDGEDTSTDQTPYSYEEMATLIDGGAVLGYGTDQGGTMIDKYGYEIHSSYTFAVGRSYLDDDNLSDIADDLGLEYIHMKRESAINPVIDDIADLSGTVTENNSDYTYLKDTYYRYVPYLAALLVLELMAGIRSNVRARRKHGRKIKKKEN